MARQLVQPALLLFVFLFLQAAAQAQYPVRPVRMLVPFPPGGGPDTVARLLGERLSTRYAQPVVVENRAGANGNLALEAIAKSAPDGYTLMMGADSMIVVNPHLYAKMPVDTLQGLAPVAMAAEAPFFFLVVHPSLPARSFREFLEHAKQARSPLAFASAGTGSQHQIAMEMLKLRAGISLLHVPYKGGNPAITAAVAGEVAAAIASPSAAAQIRSEKLRALAVTGSRRLEAFPDVPAIAEFYPGFRVSSWFAVFAPGGTPEPVVSSLRTAINQTLAAQDVKEKLNAAGGLEPYLTTPEEFAARIKADYEAYGSLIRQVGIKLD